MMTVKFHTLGCKLNFSETSTIDRNFCDGGFERATGNNADIHIINTCSVTDTADKKCRYLIRKISREDNNAIIVVTGCYAQLKPQEIAEMEGVDLVIGNNEKGNILERVRQVIEKRGKAAIYTCDTEQLTSFFNAFSSGDRIRTFLKVQDGCGYRCSYCTIPIARGASRNISIAELISQAHEVVKAGQKEIVLTGVNIGDFGRSTGERFVDLVKELDTVNGIERYRISSIEPNLLSQEIIEFTLASKKFQPHFHIPLQSGNNKILALMRRRYTSEFFRKKIEDIRAINKDVFIGIDVIVGFPGESDEDFKVTYNFLKDLSPSYLHIFPYSERANTDAINFENKVPQNVKHERSTILTQLCKELYEKYYSSFVNKEAEVLVEGRLKGGKMFGHTNNYLRVEMPYVAGSINTLVKVKLLPNGEAIAI
ncbi:MAG: tRNA (N(6)-L-threonylcarbamoyladenosine(37)-C(2))-methylthiotransferase MtaB [Rikenellaceae bacterium]